MQSTPFESGDKANPEKYRGIALLGTVVGIIFSTIMNKIMEALPEIEEKINEEQAEF